MSLASIRANWARRTAIYDAEEIFDYSVGQLIKHKSTKALARKLGVRFFEIQECWNAGKRERAQRICTQTIDEIIDGVTKQ